MSTIFEIESAIRQLPEPDFWQLSACFDQVRADAWDRKMEADAQAGRLDFLFEEAAAERAAATLRSWPSKV